jgi:electron transport complex protein RnfB
MGPPTAAERTAEIDALLPQTQCTRCGYAGCEPYAEAIAAGEAEINQCAPGGAQTILALARLLGRPVIPLNPEHGAETSPRVAWIDEARCIGCARCLPPCPVDAIVGAPKYLHAVLEERCTGCELCVAPCPVDCIEMRPSTSAAGNDAAANRARFAAHRRRALQREAARQAEITAQKAMALRAVRGEP